MTTTEISTRSGRTAEEITASVRLHMRSMVNNALEIGMDLLEMKEACRHGEWMPWLKEIGLSASTAANYMRIAREVGADSKVAQLPYTKILAIMAAPKEDREELAEAADSLSAAEIRKLTEERNKAAAAANAETVRADQAERDAKMFSQENAHLRTEIQTLKEKAEKLRADLLTAENNVIEVEKRVEVPPEDYERLKKEQKELLDAAARAEERASEAEAELERARQAGDGTKDEKPVGIVLAEAVNAFLRVCDLMPFEAAELQRDVFAVRHCMEQVDGWLRRMESALGTPVITEARVI